MYRDFFKLKIPPFSLGPQLEFRYGSESYNRGLHHLQAFLAGPDRFTLLTGTIGTGKTLVLQSFMDQLKNQHETALVTFSKITPLELMKLVLSDLELQFEWGASPETLKKTLLAHAESAASKGFPLVLIIDEAQNLPLETLDFLGELMSEKMKIVLVGQPEIVAAAQSSKLSRLGKLADLACDLFPLSRAEVGAYIRHRLSVAGNAKIPVAETALDKIMEFSLGIPRVVNTLANQALLVAYLEDRSQIQGDDVTPVDAGNLARLPGMKKRRPRAMEAVGGSARTADLSPSLRPTPVRPSPPKPSSRKVSGFETVFKKIANDCPQISGMAVLNAKGEFLAESLPPGRSVRELAPLVMALVKSSGKVASDVLDSTMRHTIVETEDGILLLAAVESGRTLALYAKGSTKLGFILMELQSWLEDLRRIE